MRFTLTVEVQRYLEAASLLHIDKVSVVFKPRQSLTLPMKREGCISSTAIPEQT